MLASSAPGSAGHAQHAQQRTLLRHDAALQAGTVRAPHKSDSCQRVRRQREIEKQGNEQEKQGFIARCGVSTPKLSEQHDNSDDDCNTHKERARNDGGFDGTANQAQSAPAQKQRERNDKHNLVEMGIEEEDIAEQGC